MVLGQVLPPPFQQPGGRLAGPEARLAWAATVREVGMLAPGDGGPEEVVRAEEKEEKSEGQKPQPQGAMP